VNPVEGYNQTPPENQEKAKVFFGHARNKASTGQYDYAIELFINGLNLDPEAVEAHQELRDISLKRKMSGAKGGLGMMDSMKLKRPSRDDKQNMLNAEKLLAYDPGNTDHMLWLIQSALKGGYYETAMWMGPILQRANIDDKKPDYNTFLALRDVYKRLEQWKLAADALQEALRLRPNDMDLTTELKNLAAKDTMDTGGYTKGGSFRDSVRDMDKQGKLLHQDKDFMDEDAHSVMIRDAMQEYKANPNDVGKVMKLVEAWEKTESLENENQAIDLLQELFDKTKQFRYRQKIGLIQMTQLRRMERSKRAAVKANPKDEALIKDYKDFVREQNEFELKEFQLASEAYPTDARLRFEMGKRMFALGQFQEAIPVFQQARMDPKFRNEAGVLVARSFLEAGFADEADDTLAALINEYQAHGDEKSKDMYYWRGRALEQKGNKQEAKNHYSKVAQWDFNYRDVQARIKRINAELAAAK
jgi:tetratricopeptide (TPR) repeat protein